MEYIAWRIEWRGREWDVRWEDGTLGGDGDDDKNAAAEAFGRFVVSNAPETDTPSEARLADAATLRALMPQFADRVISTQSGSQSSSSGGG